MLIQKILCHGVACEDHFVFLIARNKMIWQTQERYWNSDMTCIARYATRNNRICDDQKTGLL
jgi:hypothetical protein